MPHGWDGEAVTIRWTSSMPLLRKMLMASRPERSDSEPEKQATRPPMVPSLWFREFVQVGGLMAYSIDLADIYRRVARVFCTAFSQAATRAIFASIILTRSPDM